LLLAGVGALFALALLYLSRVGYQEGGVYVREAYYYTVTLGEARYTVPLASVYSVATVVFAAVGVGSLRQWSGIWAAGLGWYGLLLVAFVSPPAGVWAVPFCVLGVYWSVRGRTATPLFSRAGAESERSR
jgi:hypothetical protein